MATLHGVSMLGIGSIVVFAVIFWRVAVVEQLNPWPWVGASLLISLGSMLFGGLFTRAFLQLALFGVLWRYNSSHKAQHMKDWQAQQAAERKAVEDRKAWAQAQIQRERQRGEQRDQQGT